MLLLCLVTCLVCAVMVTALLAAGTILYVTTTRQQAIQVATFCANICPDMQDNLSHKVCYLAVVVTAHKICAVQQHKSEP